MGSLINAPEVKRGKLYFVDVGPSLFDGGVARLHKNVQSVDVHDGSWFDIPLRQVCGVIAECVKEANMLEFWIPSLEGYFYTTRDCVYRLPPDVAP